MNVVRQSEGIHIRFLAPGCLRSLESCTVDSYRFGGRFSAEAHTQENRNPMEAKLYVGNLPFSAGDADLQDMFARAAR